MAVSTRIHYNLKRHACQAAKRIGCSEMGSQQAIRIIQKGLAFCRKQSGTVINPGRLTRSKILPRRLGRRGGASVVRRRGRIQPNGGSQCRNLPRSRPLPHRPACLQQPPRQAHRRAKGQEDRFWFEAISCRCAAIIPGRHHHFRDDEGDGLAAAFGARLSGGSGSQEAQAEAPLQEGRRQSGLSHRWW